MKKYWGLRREKITHKEMIDTTYPKVGETKEKEEAENMSTLKLNTFADLLRSGASKIKK